MFSSGDADRNRIQVTITLATGEVMNGHVFAGLTGKLKDLMNHADRYLDFERRDGTIALVLKDDIRTVSLFELPRNDQLSRRMRDTASFDPWMLLGVERNSGPAEIRTAYWAKAKQYHPDMLVDKDPPREVTEFMNAMFARIHAAYQELSGEAAQN